MDVTPPPDAQPPDAQPPDAQPPAAPPPATPPPDAQPPAAPPPAAPWQASPPPAAPWQAAPPPVAPWPASPPPFAPPPYVPAPGEYPVQLSVTVTQPDLNRLWGIPFIGILVRVILAIPHLVVLWLIGLGMYVVILLGWIPILVMGRPIGIQAALIKEAIHRGTRVMAYAYFLFPGGYPPLEPGAPNPLELNISLEGRSMSRLWGIPLLGFLARIIAAIPHIIVLYLLLIVSFFIELILWIPILIMGKYPGWAMRYFTGVLRYIARVQAYVLLLPVPYPPFSFS